MYKLDDSLTKNLLNQPETGMGYQVVEIALRAGKAIPGVVYNSELFSTEPIQKRALILENFDRLLRDSEVLSSSKVDRISVLSRTALSKTPSYRSLVDSLGLKNSSGGAEDAPEENTKRGEQFKRFSAFRNDRRITASSGLVPGSYATTEEDARHVRTGREAVARYALPNPKPAVFKFTITPIENTTIRKGIVQPAYGQPGGGVEVYFVDGTGDNTVTGPEQIPEG